MSGAVSWEQLIFFVAFVSTIIGVLVGVFKHIHGRQEKMHTENMKRQSEMHKDNMDTYRATMAEQQSMRHDLRATYDQKMVILDQKIESESKRIDAIEIFNAGVRILIQAIDEFKADVKDRFEAVTSDRKEEINKIDKKLDAIISDQIRRKEQDDVEARKVKA